MARRAVLSGLSRTAALLALAPVAGAAYLTQQEQRMQAATHTAAQLMRRAGFEPDDWQSDVLESDAQQIILNVTRQGGKSRVASVLATQVAINESHAPILVLSPSLRQSGELFRGILSVYQRSGRLIDAEAESKSVLELENGSRILSLPGGAGQDVGRTIRGYSGVRLVIIDEASRVPDSLYYAVRPMLATSGGRIVLLSTPYGKRGFFHHEWTEGGSDWHRVEVKAEQISRIPAEFLEQERRMMPARLFRQEYECSFEETEDSVFSYGDIEAMFVTDGAPLFSTNGHDRWGVLA